MAEFSMHARLANDLACRFHGRPQVEAVPALAEYLRTYWDSRMLLALCSHLDSTDKGTDPLITAAVAHLRRHRRAR